MVRVPGDTETGRQTTRERHRQPETDAEIKTMEIYKICRYREVEQKCLTKLMNVKYRVTNKLRMAYGNRVI